MHRRARGVLAVLVVACVVALPSCRTTAPPLAPPPADAPAIPADGNAFVVGYTVNDTWNAVGQILVALPGVTYETRAQMLALYAVRYRGESFLLRVQGLPLEPESPVLRSRVEALTPSGAPLRTLATSELLGLLGPRVVAETPMYRARLDAQEKAAAEAARKRPARRKVKKKAH